MNYPTGEIKTVIKLLKEEVKWCVKSKKVLGNVDKAFIKGLRHAIRLAQLVK